MVAHIERIPDPTKRERQFENILKGPESSYFPGGVRRFARLLGDLNAALQSGDWLAGADYSLADIGYTPYMVRLEHLQLAWMWDDKPELAAWFGRLRSRPSFKAAVTDWFNPKYLPLMAEKGAGARAQIEAIVAEM